MVRLIFYMIAFLAFGFTILANISGAASQSLEFLTYWFDKETAFYELVSKLFILATHPLWLLFLSFGTLMIMIRIFIV